MTNKICEFAGCNKPAIAQGKMGHLLEDRWLCQECYDNPLEIVTESDIQKINLKIEEQQNFLRKTRKEVKQKISEYEKEIKQIVFDGLKTYKIHPKLELDNKILGNNSLSGLEKIRLEVEAPEFLVLGTWTCIASPTGSCVYDEVNDPYRDCCIFCGKPEERK